MSHTIETVLQMEGIMAKGYGLVAKYPMQDTSLKIKDKAIYAYLCSLSGSGVQTFPSRGKILADLQIGKKAFYNSMDRLLKEGYLTKTEKQLHGEHGFWTKCTYTIVLNPKRYQEKKQEPTGDDERESTLSINGMLSDGWGISPRLVMQDTRLTVREKALYAYIMTYAAVGRVAYPTVDTITYHLNISEESYRTLMKNLCKLGYIVRSRKRKKNGQLGGYDYYIPEKPIPVVCELTTLVKGDTVETTTPMKGDTVETTTPMKGDTVETTTPTKGDTVSEPPPSKADTVEAPTVEAPTAKGYVRLLQDPLLQSSLLQGTSTTTGSAAGTGGNPSDAEMRKKIEKAGGIPVDVLDDKAMVIDALRILGDWNWKNSEPRYCDPDMQKAYKLVMETLVTLCTRKTSRIGNLTLKREQIIEKLNRCCEKDSYGTFLSDYIQYVTADYVSATINRLEDGLPPVKQPARYAASVIWSGTDRYLQERAEQDYYMNHYLG